jgi:hypothetical protein
MINAASGANGGAMELAGKGRGRDLVLKIRALNEAEYFKDDLDRLYGILSILDTKATGLLTVNTLMLAALAILLNSPGTLREIAGIVGSPMLRWLDEPVIPIQLALSAVSSALCLLVVSITWRFLKNMPQKATDTSAFERELHHLANVINDRTLYYMLAWWLTFVAMALTLAWWGTAWYTVAVLAIACLLWRR